MRRGKVVLKKIENKVKRQRSFSKRKDGILKKAIELSVLCDVDVALIMFSNTDQLFGFGSTDINKILGRYYHHRYNNSGRSNTNFDDHARKIEMSRLRAENEFLQRCHRQKLESLNLKELDNLEIQLVVTLSQIRKLEAEIIHKKIADLSRREHDLADRMAQLKSQIEEGKKCMQQNDDDLEDLNMSSRDFESEEESDDGSYDTEEESDDDGSKD